MMKETRKRKSDGHITKSLLTELGLDGRKNSGLSVMTHGPCCARSVLHDLESNIFPTVRTT